jgi:hypothetical protein
VAVAGAPAVGEAQVVLATITVPVRLSGLQPEVTGGSVRCIVHGQDFNNQRVGNNTAPFSVDSTGSVNQNVVVTVTATPGANLALATRYSCFLEINGPTGVRNPSTNANDPAWQRAKPGTTLVWQLSGALPQ